MGGIGTFNIHKQKLLGFNEKYGNETRVVISFHDTCYNPETTLRNLV